MLIFPGRIGGVTSVQGGASGYTRGVWFLATGVVLDAGYWDDAKQFGGSMTGRLNDGAVWDDARVW